MFKLEIKTGGAAFRDENDELDFYGAEIIKLLNEVSSKLYRGYHNGILVDTNGNKVGSWRYTDD